jgi:hypothetical protein
MYMLLLQNVHAIITKCTCYYYKMYMLLLQNVHGIKEAENYPFFTKKTSL